MDVEFIAKTVVAGTAIIGLFIGLWQYMKAQQWKRAEFAAKQLDKLTTDPLLSLACTLLDWNGRTFKVPDSYRYKAEKETFIHSWEVLEKAMVPELLPVDGRKGFEWDEVLYRDIFDHFFTYLVMLNHYIDIKLLSVDDIFILKYWLQQINKPDQANKKPIFQGFIRRFGYEGVTALSRKLGVN